MNNIKLLENELQPLLNQLNNHRLYNNLKTIDDVKIFMEHHVFAVWDFMSLLKALQNKLTCTTFPWIPVKNPSTARFINEIVLGEESDVNENGEAKSHFEMYLDAMKQVGANTSQIKSFVNFVTKGIPLKKSAQLSELNNETFKFVEFTFNVIASEKTHLIASAFTFGREDVIPDMFFQIINQSETNHKSYSKLKYYLERHIELDGDEHGPLSLKMIEELCGTNQNKWEEAKKTAIKALKQRIALWDNIANLIEANKIIEV